MVYNFSRFNSSWPSLLMIHGVGSHGLIFYPQLKMLNEGINVMAVDLPGHGFTPGPSYDLIEGYIDWLVNLLKSNSVNPILLGHSMGGGIVLGIALYYSELIKGLVLVSAASKIDLPLNIINGLKREFLVTLGLVVKYVYTELTKDYVIFQGLKVLLKTRPEVILNDFICCSRYDFTEKLDKIQLPTLIIIGEEDRLISKNFSQILFKNIVNSKLISIKGGGHMVFLEKYSEVNEAIANFIVGMNLN